MNTGFYSIFNDKLKKMRKELRRELEVAKSDRRREFIKIQIREIKRLRQTVHDMEKHMDIKTDCPHCGGKL